VRNDLRVTGANAPSCWLLLGPSGTGKTSCIFELARSHYVIFVEAVEHERPHVSSDSNFARMLGDVQAMALSGASKQRLRDYTGHRVLVELLARLLLLTGLLQLSPTLQPLEFLLASLYIGTPSMFIR
jgi:hypothetical protein